MRVFLTALTTFLVGGVLLGGLFVGLYFAVRTPSTSNEAKAKTAAMPHMGGGMVMSGSTMMASSSLAAQKLTIQHVHPGCHVWSMDGKTMGAMMRPHLKPGQRLLITDADVDAHQMMELGGPMHMQMGGPMMTSHTMTLTFSKKGVYRLGTKTVEMPGGGMDVKTIGPDNHLRLVVSVA